MSDFHGRPTRRLQSKVLTVDCLTTAGPRIVRLQYNGSANLLAEVPEFIVETALGRYHFIGGHRLWYAPESMPQTYIPDDEGCRISELTDGLMLEGRAEPGTGIRKRLEIRLCNDQPKATLMHTLTNEGPAEVLLGPWAVTMLRLGGIGILPLRAAGGSAEDLPPDRRLVLWPPSSFHDRRLELEDEFLLVHALKDMPPFKVGGLDHAGWLAYWIDGVLFRKSFETDPAAEYPDLGCNGEIYCDSHSLELESLGPMIRLQPGGSVSLGETWELYDSLEQEFVLEDMRARIAKHEE